MGMMNGNNSPWQITEYTHGTAWKSDTLGNTLNFVNTYFNQGNGLYYAEITNNSETGNYKALEAVLLKGVLVDSLVHGEFCRVQNVATAMTTGTSFYISEGAKIRVKYLSVDKIKE